MGPREEGVILRSGISRSVEGPYPLVAPPKRAQLKLLANRYRTGVGGISTMKGLLEGALAGCYNLLQSRRDALARIYRTV